MGRKFFEWRAGGGQSNLTWLAGRIGSLIARDLNRWKARSVCAFVFQGPKLGADDDSQLITKSPHEMRKPPPLNETCASLPLLSSPLLSHSLWFSCRHSAKQKSCKRESDVEEEGSFEFMKR